MSARFPVGAHTPTGTIDDGAWVEFAICAPHVELFFEPFNERPSARQRRETNAKAMCAVCPVRISCREAGRRNHESGIWGGETEEERARAGFAPRASARRSVTAARRAGATGGDGDLGSDPDHEAA